MKCECDYKQDPFVRSLIREIWVMRVLLLIAMGTAFWAMWQAQTASEYWSRAYAPTEVRIVE